MAAYHHFIFFLSLAPYSFMMAVFWAGALVQEGAKPFLAHSASFLMVAMPIGSVLAASLIWVGFFLQWTKYQYGWVLAPLSVFLYFFILLALTAHK